MEALRERLARLSAHEKVLALCGWQAATAIANPRTNRGQRRARADAEALIETSPVVQPGGAAVRAKEIKLSVPDGRSITPPVKAAPTRSADGEVESIMVTMRDLASLEKLERLRPSYRAWSATSCARR